MNIDFLIRFAVVQRPKNIILYSLVSRIGQWSPYELVLELLWKTPEGDRLPEVQHGARQLHLIHQLVKLAALRQVVDVRDRDADQEVHNDKTEYEEEHEEGEMGSDRELREDRLLLNLGPIFDDQILWVLKLQELNLPQHHHHDANYRPRESFDVEMSLPGEEDGEHHHEANGHPDVGNTEYEHFLRHRPKHGE